MLVACLVQLRAEINTLAPNRDTGADGWIGDAAHRQRSSDHNPDETGKTPFKDADTIDEVHALDIDSTGPWPPGKDLEWIVETIRGRHLRGFDNRLQNIIYRAQIASKTWGWTWKPYDGADRHIGHAHFSAVYTSAQEADVRPWGVLANARRLLTMESLEGYGLPVLALGDDDADDDGYNLVKRAQRLLAWIAGTDLTPDGVYGPATAAAVKSLGLNNGTTIDRQVWAKLYGLSRTG
ncbi:MAG: peptidoglycan-binding protein [Streptomyces sp.]|uniref:peptidoglycan-binding domain-containing protein n=1 Tax=Streptomyces sp. TaxID=1931 RepID=UPI0025EDAA07|nr:peptidoglycan-binding domain-containing protein [Streptomyces sp.]MBW8792157.1 peptidoglycan-binding protein [Streptomyces sp.]